MRDEFLAGDGLPGPRDDGGDGLGLLADARDAGALDPGLDLRLVRDLLFGAMNAPALRGRRPEDAAGVLAVLIGLN